MKEYYNDGRQKLGAINGDGDERLRAVLVSGATAFICHANRPNETSPWLVELLKRKPPKKSPKALANKTARIAWQHMTSGER